MDEYRFDHLSSSHGSRQSRMTTQRETTRLYNTGNHGTYSATNSLTVIPNSPGLSSIASNPTDRPPLPMHSMTTSALHTPSNTSIHQISANTQHQLDEIQDKQRLEKQNFELKMKIYHLEDTIHTLQEKEIQRQAASSQHSSEINDLKLLLEERNLELEERNLILIKAKNAMEILKTELQRSQLDAAKQTELQEKILSLKQMNDEIERDYKQQLTTYEHEIKSSKQTVNLKEQEISVLEDQIRQLEITIERLKQDYDGIQKDKEKTETIWMNAQERISLLEEEVTQCHAHIDLYKLRVQEETEEKQSLQAQLKDLVAKKAAQEEESRHRLQDTTQKLEMQIHTMRSSHEQEIEKMRSEHLQLLSDMRENYHQETSRTKAMYDQELQDIKTLEANEKSRQREDFMDRLSEKNEEIRALKAQLESQQQKFERLLYEAESYKSQLKEKQNSIEMVKIELQAKGEEITSLLTLKETIHSLQQKIIEMQETQKKENIEKLQLSFQKDTIANQLAQLEHEYKQLEAESHLLKIENSKLSYATNDLSTKNDTIDSISREVDKYRIIQQKLSNEILEGQYKYQHLLKEHEALQQEHLRDIQQQKASQEELKRHQQTIETLQASLQAEKEQLKKESERKAVAESLLQEIRENYSKLKVDYEAAKNQAVQESEEVLEEKEDWKQQVNDWIGIYLMMLHALEEWDDSLGAVVEGERAIPASSSFLFPYQQQHQSYGGPGQGSSLASWLSSQHQTSFTTADLYQSRSSNRSTPLKSATPRSTGRSTTTTAPRGLGRTQSPSSRRFGASSRSHVAFNNEYEYYAEVFTSRIHEARQEIAVGIERISLKHDKIQNLRSFYHQEETRILQQFAQFSDKTASTLTQCQEQINRLSSELHHCQKVMSHDQQVLQQERQDFQALKEVLLKEHQEKYHQLEVKYTEVCIKLESAQRIDENHQRQLQQIMTENKELQQLILKYKKEIQQIHQVEEGIQQFHQKYEILQKQYQQGQQDIQKLQTSIQQVQSEKNTLQQEKQAFVAELDRWKQQCNLLRDNVQESERRLQVALLEVEKAHTRPIDAELALKLLSFHQREAAVNSGGNSTAPSSPPQGSNNAYGSARNMLELIERLSPVRSTRSEREHNTSSSYNFSSSSNLHRNLRSTTPTALRGSESVYFPSRRGLMTAATERFDGDEGFVGTASSASTMITGTGGNTSSRLSNIDRSLQALAKKLDAFDKTTAP